MKFAILLLATIVAAAPPADNDNDLVVTKEFFPNGFAVYTGKHDIVDIVVPINQINFPEELTGETVHETLMTIFFVEADVKDSGVKDYKGLYVYKNHEAKMVLENGQCTTYAKKTSVYFGAKDGIYKYNVKDMTATKYGTVTDSVIRMAIDTKNARVYYLTADYLLYKFNEGETASEMVDAVKDARDIAFDFQGNMFYYNGNHQFYTYNGERVLKIQGLPANPTKVDLVRAPITIDEVYAVIDGRLYEIKYDGNSEMALIKFQSKPTAFAPDTLFFQYYAYKQKIYMYNLVSLMEDSEIEDLTPFFSENQEQLNTIKSTKVSSRL